MWLLPQSRTQDQGCAWVIYLGSDLRDKGKTPECNSGRKHVQRLLLKVARANLILPAFWEATKCALHWPPTGQLASFLRWCVCQGSPAGVPRGFMVPLVRKRDIGGVSGARLCLLSAACLRMAGLKGRWPGRCGQEGAKGAWFCSLFAGTVSLSSIYHKTCKVLSASNFWKRQ